VRADTLVIVVLVLIMEHRFGLRCAAAALSLALLLGIISSQVIIGQQSAGHVLLSAMGGQGAWAGAPESGAQQRYSKLARLLSSSRQWAADVKDKRLEAQLEISEAQLAALQARSPSAGGARVHARSQQLNLVPWQAMKKTAADWAAREESKLMHTVEKESPKPTETKAKMPGVHPAAAVAEGKDAHSKESRGPEMDQKTAFADAALAMAKAALEPGRTAHRAGVRAPEAGTAATGTAARQTDDAKAKREASHTGQKTTRPERTEVSHTVPTRVLAPIAAKHVSVQQARTPPVRSMQLLPKGSAVDWTKWRQGLSAPLSVGDSAHGSTVTASAAQTTLCQQPLPTMLHHEMHAMLCWTLQLADDACSALWATVPVLYSDTIGIALRRRVSPGADLREVPTKVVFDVAQVEQGTTHGVNMGSMAASFTYNGVSAAWEHHGTELVHSFPQGMDWVTRWLGFHPGGMRVHVRDCVEDMLAWVTILVKGLALDRKVDGAPVRVATIGTDTGRELAVMRSALGGTKLGWVYELLDQDGEKVGIMIEEGQADAWLIQMDRSAQVDLRALAVLAATMSIAGQEETSGFFVGLTVPLIFLLAALAIALCIRLCTASTGKRRKSTAVQYYEALYGEVHDDRRASASDAISLDSPPPMKTPDVHEIPVYQAAAGRQARVSSFSVRQPLTMEDEGEGSRGSAPHKDRAGTGPGDDTGLLPVAGDHYSKLLSRTEVHAGQLAAQAHSDKRTASHVVELGSLQEREREREKHLALMEKPPRGNENASETSDVALGRRDEHEASVEQWQRVPLEFSHGERPRIVSGPTAAAFRGVDEALAAVEAALAARPRPGGDVQDRAFEGVSRALGSSAKARSTAGGADAWLGEPNISTQRRRESEKRFQDALLDHVIPPSLLLPVTHVLSWRRLWPPHTCTCTQSRARACTCPNGSESAWRGDV
jgi:hypothetical protein